MHLLQRSLWIDRSDFGAVAEGEEDKLLALLQDHRE